MSVKYEATRSYRDDILWAVIRSEIEDNGALTSNCIALCPYRCHAESIATALNQSAFIAGEKT